MTSVTQEEIYQICEEGERRYKTDPQTPPGFKDAKNKDGVRKYSDLIRIGKKFFAMQEKKA